jgi:hypothetical protein
LERDMCSDILIGDSGGYNNGVAGYRNNGVFME